MEIDKNIISGNRYRIVPVNESMRIIPDYNEGKGKSAVQLLQSRVAVP